MAKPSVKVGDTLITNEGCKVKVTHYQNRDNVTIEFQGEFIHSMVVNASNLKAGKVKNPYLRRVYGIGYFGIGKHITRENNKQSLAYRAWFHMMSRCYDAKFHEMQPTYKDCTVAEIWHNFQNFAEWYTSQEHYGKGYQLDKDILIGGNKVYSPSTCVLAPKEINMLFADCGASRGAYPVGVCWDKERQKFSSVVTINAKSKYLGRFDTVEQASQAYQVAKKANIKRMALEWQNRIDEKLFNALLAKAV